MTTAVARAAATRRSAHAAPKPEHHVRSEHGSR